MTPEKTLRLGEFVSLMALMTSLVALSIDAMLPALGDIGRELGTTAPNQSQLVVSALFLGLALGQFIYGPISDSTGRKRPIFAGLALYLVGTLLCVLSKDFETMLAGRFLQGLGVAGPRIVTIALVRDQYEGPAMARIMSLIMAVFIIVPAVAPALGQVILEFTHWRAIFGLLLGLSLIALTWFALRQPETLPNTRRIPWSVRRLASGLIEAVRTRTAFGYALAAGTIFGGFIGYLISAPQIFQQQYGVPHLFPLFFALLSLAIGAAALLNARLVLRFGMYLLTRTALQVQCAVSIAVVLAAWWAPGGLPLWAFMGWGSVAFFCQGLLIGNFNAIAMEPLGHIAGVGAAMVGVVTSFLSLTLGTTIGQAYDGTVIPLIGGFAVLGLLSLTMIWWTRRTED
ncbi:MAG: multidrug effflux MFS transporter [Rhodospirillaceae bacterium]|nr:multidrug effflux MFS transporter [Rhodospirillaceae bacterium]